MINKHFNNGCDDWEMSIIMSIMKTVLNFVNPVSLNSIKYIFRERVNETRVFC